MRTRRLASLAALAAAVALVPAGAAGANPRPKTVTYAGKTKEGSKISFTLRKGWIEGVRHVRVPVSCVSAQGGTMAFMSLWWPDHSYMYRPGKAYKWTEKSYPTTNYRFSTAKHKDGRITGKLASNWSRLGIDSWGGYKIWECQSSSSFTVRPKKAKRK